MPTPIERSLAFASSYSPRYSSRYAPSQLEVAEHLIPLLGEGIEAASEIHSIADFYASKWNSSWETDRSTDHSTFSRLAAAETARAVSKSLFVLLCMQLYQIGSALNDSGFEMPVLENGGSRPSRAAVARVYTHRTILEELAAQLAVHMPVVTDASESRKSTEEYVVDKMLYKNCIGLMSDAIAAVEVASSLAAASENERVGDASSGKEFSEA